MAEPCGRKQPAASKSTRGGATSAPTRPRARKQKNINPKKRSNQMQPLICQLLPHIKLSGRIGPGWIAGRARKAPKAKLLWKSPPRRNEAAKDKPDGATGQPPRVPELPVKTSTTPKRAPRRSQHGPPRPLDCQEKPQTALENARKRPDKTLIFSLQNSSFPARGSTPPPTPSPGLGRAGDRGDRGSVFRSRWLQ